MSYKAFTLGVLHFNVDYEQFFRNFFMAFTLWVFCQKSAERKSLKKYFFHISFLCRTFLWTHYLLDYVDIHTYIIGHSNPSVRIIALASHIIYVVCVNFIHKWRSYSLKSSPNDRFFLRNGIVDNFNKLGCNMSIKLHHLHSDNDFSPEDLGAVSEDQDMGSIVWRKHAGKLLL